MAREDRRPGGLGRPLDAIIAGARVGPSQWTVTAETGPDLEPVMAAGLDAIGGALNLDLAGYLHLSPDRGPHLVARLASGSPAPEAAFELLTVGIAALEPDGTIGDARVLDLSVVTITTVGPRSRGVHLLGRQAPGLDDDEVGVAHRLCSALASACHTLEEAWSTATAWMAGTERSAS